jgi:iron complex transport system substrate-binding protein
MRSALLLLALACGTLIAPAHAQRATAISVVDDHGTRLTLAAPPRRLISLAPNVTEILFALGLGSEVVGVSSYSDYPAAAKRLPQVISYTTVDYEKILSLKPDLVVAAGIVPQVAIDKLRSLRVPVLVTDPHDISGILNDIRVVGTATGVPTTGRTLVARLQTRIDAIAAKVRRATTHPRVYYELDQTLYTAGHGSFVDALIRMAGGVNIAGTIMNPYPQLSAETLIAANPQYIILGDYYTGHVSVASVAARPGYGTIAAVRLHHIYPFNDDLVSRPGPRIVDGLAALARLLHPDLFS